jgi:prophage regulatory protein
MKLIRLPSVLDQTGNGRSTAYQQIADGLLPKPVLIGLRAKAFPQHEIDAVVAARIAGSTPEEIRELVASLHAKRKEAA